MCLRDAVPLGDQTRGIPDGDAFNEGHEGKDAASAVALRAETKPVVFREIHDELVSVRPLVQRAHAAAFAACAA